MLPQSRAALSRVGRATLVFGAVFLGAACGASAGDAGSRDAEADAGPRDAQAPDALMSGAECNPLIDRCGENLVCTPAVAPATTCAAAGTAVRGASCAMARCQKGSVCLDISGTPGAICYQACDPTLTPPRCSASQAVCVGLASFPFGICKLPVRTCDPLGDPCPGGRTCRFDPPDLQCGLVGSTMAGGDCSMEPCQRGLICVRLMGRPGPECFQPCDPNNPVCLGGAGFQCASIGEPFGICASN